MATIFIAGTVTGKPGESPVTVRTFENGDTVASFSVLDKAYVPTKGSDEKQGQFYRCEVRGKAAEICSDRLQRGDKIGVSGQLVQRVWNDKLQLDVKNSQVTFLEYRQAVKDGEIPF